jgi:acetyl-CoA carboxylase beta subunit
MKKIRAKPKALLGFAARRVFKPGDLIRRHIWPKRPPP